MPTFIGQVKDSKGKISKEKIEATSPEQARSLLQQKYPAVGKIQESNALFDFSNIEAAMSGLTVKDKAVFSRQFSAMVDA